MKTSNPGPLRVPGVLAALTWLTDVDETPCVRQILKIARVQGILPVTPDGGRWRCDGQILQELVQKKTRIGQMPSKGDVLIGLGELTARSHVSRPEFERDVGRMLFSPSFTEEGRRQFVHEALQVAQSWINGDPQTGLLIYEQHPVSINEWSNATLASDWIRHPPRPIIFAGYGVGFLASVYLRRAPGCLAWFLNETSDRGLLLPAIAALGESCTWEEEMAKSALETGVPFVVALGAAKLQSGNEDGQGWPASSVDSVLANCGVPSEGRRAISALALKESVHAWYRQKDRAQDARMRQETLRHAPEHAIGGARYATDEIVRLDTDIKAYEERRDAVIAKLEDALSTAAALDVPPSTHWRTFEPSFVDTPEIRYRFAMKHTDAESRREALEMALAAFDDILRIRRPEGAIFEPIDTTRTDRDLAFWAACSQEELSQIKNRDLGRDAALRIVHLEKALRAYALQPFAAERFGLRFQNALTRWSLLLQFVFRICTSQSGAQLETLRNLALSSAQSFLLLTSRSSRHTQPANAVIDLVADAILASNNQIQAQWLEDARMPVLLRSSLAWSSVDVLQDRAAFSQSLLEQAAKGTARTLKQWNASVLTALLDRAAAAVYRARRPDMAQFLEIPYNLAVSCHDVPLAKSLDLETLLAAVNGDDLAQRRVCENPAWCQSRTAYAFARPEKVPV